MSFLQADCDVTFYEIKHKFVGQNVTIDKIF